MTLQKDLEKKQDRNKSKWTSPFCYNQSWRMSDIADENAKPKNFVDRAKVLYFAK